MTVIVYTKQTEPYHHEDVHCWIKASLKEFLNVLSRFFSDFLQPYKVIGTSRRPFYIACSGLWSRKTHLNVAEKSAHSDSIPQMRPSHALRFCLVLHRLQINDGRCLEQALGWRHALSYSGRGATLEGPGDRDQDLDLG